MNVFDAISTRRSIRQFKTKRIEEDKLKRILTAACLAPSARNMQDRRFILVRDPAIREQLMKCARNQTFLLQAPVVIAACATMPDYVMTCGQPSGAVDAAIAVDHITLQAVEEGLGTCWVCSFTEAEVNKILQIPAGVRVVALVALGYPAESPAAKPRREINEMVSVNRYSETPQDPFEAKETQL